MFNIFVDLNTDKGLMTNDQEQQITVNGGILYMYLCCTPINGQPSTVNPVNFFDP
jgi:hypothetical protein